MKLQHCLPGAGRGGLFGPATPVHARLSAAIAASIALHTAIALAVHPSRVAPRPQGYLFTARLAPAAEYRDRTAPAAAPGARLPEQAPVAAAPQPQNQAAFSQPDAPAQTGWAGSLLTAPRYYLASELERQPGPLQPIEPETPAQAGELEGSVVLRLDVDERGTVDEAEVVGADPGGPLEKSALAAFANARFSPGMRNGVPVKSRIFVEVQYRSADPSTPPSRGTRGTSGRGY